MRSITDDLIAEADRTDVDAPRCSKLLRDAAERIRTLEQTVLAKEVCAEQAEPAFARRLCDALGYTGRQRPVSEMIYLVRILRDELKGYQTDRNAICVRLGINPESDTRAVLEAIELLKTRVDRSTRDLHEARDILDTQPGSSVLDHAKRVMECLQTATNDGAIAARQRDDAVAAITNVCDRLVSKDFYKRDAPATRWRAAIDAIDHLKARERTLDEAVSRFQLAAGGVNDSSGLFAYGVEKWTDRVVEAIGNHKLELVKDTLYEVKKALEGVEAQRGLVCVVPDDLPRRVRYIGEEIVELSRKLMRSEDLSADRINSIRRIAAALNYELPKSGYIDEILSRIEQYRSAHEKVEAARKALS